MSDNNNQDVTEEITIAQHQQPSEITQQRGEVTQPMNYQTVSSLGGMNGEQSDNQTYTPIPSFPIQSHTFSNTKSSFLERVIRSTIAFTPPFHLVEKLESYLSENFYSILDDMGYRPDFHNRIQFSFLSTMEKFKGNNETDVCEHYTQIAKSNINSNTVKQNMLKLIKNIANAKTKESGWTLKHINKTYITLFTTDRDLKRYGKYVPTPEKLPGSRSILNIKTEYNCVELSLIAYFMLKDGSLPSTKNNRSDKKHYEKNRGKYFTFPIKNGEKVTIDHFDKIEKSLKHNITIYQLKQHNNNYSINIIRKKFK